MVRIFLFISISAITLFGKASAFGVIPENLTETKQIQSYFASVYDGSYPSDCSGVRPSNFRNGIIPEHYRWKNFNVYLESSFDDMERKLINNAMHRLSEYLPCVNFKLMPENSTPDGDSILVVKQNGCSSYMGRIGGIQRLSLGNGCVHISVILHEFIHALGVDHEQCRSDRNDHINILEENIIPEMMNQFDIGDPTMFSTFDVDYNTKSIMHYGSYLFSANGEPTMLTKNGEVIERNYEVQETDVRKLRLMYQC